MQNCGGYGKMRATQLRWPSVGEKNNSRACKSAAQNNNNTNAIGALIHIKATKADEVVGTIQGSAYKHLCLGPRHRSR